MGKRMGTPKPLARSSAISGKESTKNEEAMEMYTEVMEVWRWIKVIKNLEVLGVLYLGVKD